MTLAQRYATVDRWCRTRGISDLYTFFAADAPVCREYYLRIRSVANGSTAVVDTDLPWVMAMEDVISRFLPARNLATVAFEASVAQMMEDESFQNARR
jgi:hypothetical protein